MKALQTMNKTHAKYEAACGIVDVIELFDPHLKGKVAIHRMHPRGSKKATEYKYLAADVEPLLEVVAATTEVAA